MPIYEYECLECGMHFDRLQRFGETQPVSCPNGHRKVHRLLSQPTVIFKGSGFYVTDNGRNGSATSPRKTGHKASSENPAKGETEPAPASQTGR
jgi:putative FmdB family regulatory protein